MSATPYKSWDTFKSVDQFLSRLPKEITVVNGVTPIEILNVVRRVDCISADGTVTTLHEG